MLLHSHFTAMNHATSFGPPHDSTRNNATPENSPTRCTGCKRLRSWVRGASSASITYMEESDNACARMLDPEASSFSLLHLGLLLCSLSSASALSCFWLRVSLRFGPLLAKMVSIGGYVLFSESRRENFHGPSSCGVSAAVVSPLMETVDGDCGFLEPLRRGGGALLYNSSQEGMAQGSRSGALWFVELIVMVNSRRFNSRVFSVRLLSSLARVDYIASHKLPIFWFSISSKGIRIMVSVLVVSLLSRVHIPVLVVDRLVCDW
ncbi:hypothetical protein Bca101_059375 [Brassica carinata]